MTPIVSSSVALRSLACSVVASLFAGSVFGGVPTLSVIEIPMPADGVTMVARGINSRGDVAGYFTSNSGQTSGFVWSDGTLTTLPPLPGHTHSIAQDIGDSGLIAGYSGPFTSPDKAVVWSSPPRPQPQALGTFGGPWSSANGVSSNGLVSGWAQVEETSSRFHGFVYDGSAMRDVGLLAGGVVTDLADVNADGMAVGIGQTIEGHFRAILVDPAEGILDLGTLGGVTSEAEAISDAGHITGRAQIGVPNAATFEGIVRHAFLWHEGRILDLGTLPGLIESRGMGVNSAGQVVGQANNASLTMYAPFRWQDGAMIDLNSLLPPGSGWVLRTANAINESGWIVGEGTFNGQPRAYVLRPSAPTP
jgi:probable HAF family extracellular repeat protein